MLGASRGEAGILGEGIRQALLRDPTYAAGARRGQRAGAVVRLVQSLWRAVLSPDTASDSASSV